MAELTDRKRLQALDASGLLDSPPEEAFDRLTLLASKFLRVPVALVSLVDDRRQFFKSCVGLPPPWDSLRETPLSHSFCKFVVVSEEPLIVSDSRLDPQLQHNGAVSDLGVIAYLGVPLTGSDGEILGSFCVIDGESREWSSEEIGTMQDLSRCVESEIRLRYLLDRQQSTISTLQEENVTHQQDARNAHSRSERKSEFLARLGHELRNPLAPILNAAQLLSADALSDAEKPAIYELINQQLEQVLRLVDDMLDMSRIEQGKIELCKKHIDLRSVITEAVESVRPLFDSKSQRLQVGSMEEALIVDGDHGRLVQATSNLLTNASRYTPVGGKIEVVCSVADGFCEIRVTDSGIGIAAESLQSIFKPFEQVEGAAVKNQGGLGLGLALVNELIALHQGSVVAESEGEASGSTFRIQLPAAAASATAERLQPKKTADAEQAGPRMTALVVDDTPAICFMFRRLLASIGQDARVAASVKEAWEAIDKRVPEVIFSDIEMPEVNGYDFVRQLKQDLRTSDVPVVAVTGSTSHVAAIKDAGFDHYLAKPVHVDDLRALLQSILGSDPGRHLV